MSRDLYEVLERAAKPTLERIRQECEDLPPRLAALVAYIEENLFDPQLSVERARAAAGAKSHSLPKQFHAHLGTSIKVYVETARMEIADRLLRLGRFEVGRVSMAVGFSYHATFLRAYKEWAGELPSAVGAKPDAPEIDYPTWRRVWHRELDHEESRDVLEKYLRLYPDAGTLIAEDADAAEFPAPRMEADGERYERFRARELWRRMGHLPAAAQRLWLRQCDFRTSALFDVLREISREEGRRDRRRGIRIAKLALFSLEGREEVFGERIHDLRALGHAWLANAYRLAFELPLADAEFERAKAEWRVPRRNKDWSAGAEIAFLEGALRILQRSYGEAIQLVERAQDLFRVSDDTDGQAKAVAQRAAIHGYTGAPEDAISVLQTAKDLSSGNDPHLAYVIHCNLANDQAKLGRYSSASENLHEAKRYWRRLGHPLGALRIQGIKAVIRQGEGEHVQAESLFVAARIGFAEFEAFDSFALVSLDLAVLYSEQSRWAKVLEIAGEVVPILQSRRLYEETLAAVRLLAQAVDAGEVSSTLLRQVRDALLRDPLAGHSP